MGKKILMVVHSYYKVDTRVRREAEALVRAGSIVDIVCLNAGGEPKTEVFNGVSIFRVPASRSKKPSKFNYIYEYLLFFILAFWQCSVRSMRCKYDVFVAHNMPNFIVFCGLIIRLRGGVIVLDMHDSMPELFVSIYGVKSQLIKKLLLLEERLSNRFASARMTANIVLRDILRERNHTEYFLLHNTPDKNVLKSASKEAVRKPAEKDENRRYKLLHHGNIHERYGLDRVLPALAELNRNEIRYMLEVHGRGPWYDTVKLRAKELKVEEYCRFEGGFDPEDAAVFLREADVGLVLNREDALADLLLPVKMLEYLANCIPVICPRTAGIEAYFNDDDVFYFDNEEDLPILIRKICSDYQLASQKAVSAYKKYSAISWDKEEERFVKFIEAF